MSSIVGLHWTAIMEGPRKIPEAEWDIYKERLQSLYVTENKTLEQVIEIIASDYGFRARLVNTAKG